LQAVRRIKITKLLSVSIDFRFFTEGNFGLNVKVMKKLAIVMGTKSLSDNSTGCQGASADN